MRTFSTSASVAAVLAGLVVAALDAPNAALMTPVNAAQPSPVVSVTTLPAIPSPQPHRSSPTPAPPLPSPAPTAPPTVGPATPVTPTPSTPAIAPTPAPDGSTISVVGMVSNPLTITLKDLERLPHTSLTVRVVDPDGRHRVHFFTGVALRDILSLAKPQTAGGVDNSTRGYVTISGVNGDSAIVSLPEIEPNFNGKQVLVAYLIDARLLLSLIHI